MPPFGSSNVHAAVLVGNRRKPRDRIRDFSGLGSAGAPMARRARGESVRANDREEVAMFSGRQEMLETFQLFFATVGVVSLALWVGYLAAQMYYDARRHPRSP
jgi:hypothetical protein